MVSGVKINHFFNVMCPVEKLDDFQKELQALARKYDISLCVWSPVVVVYPKEDK